MFPHTNDNDNHDDDDDDDDANHEPLEVPEANTEPFKRHRVEGRQLAWADQLPEPTSICEEMVGAIPATPPQRIRVRCGPASQYVHPRSPAAALLNLPVGTPLATLTPSTPPTASAAPHNTPAFPEHDANLSCPLFSVS